MPEFRIAMVVRGYRRNHGGVVHLAPRERAHALCGAGNVSQHIPNATESDVCAACLSLAKGAV